MAKAIKDNINIFAKRLNELIKERKLVHEDIAQGIGVTRQGVGKWVSGDSVPDVLTVAKLAKFFNVSVDYLAGNSDPDVRTADTNLQAVCKFTGLNEKAVKIIIDHITPTCPAFKPKYYERQKRILNTILSNRDFWSIVFYYDIMISYNERVKQPERHFETIGNFNPNCEIDRNFKILYETYNQNDLIRYYITKKIENISDLFDVRSDDKKEAPENGKHNPKNE